MTRKKITKEVVEAYQRAFTLRDKAKSWAEVARILKAEGYRNSEGDFFTASTLRSQYSRRRDKIMKMDPEQFPSGSTLHARANENDLILAQESEPQTLGHEQIRKLIREELSRILETTELRIQRPGRSGKGESATVKKSFSLPRELWQEVETLGGIASNHIAMALQLYLRMKKMGKA